MNDVAEREVDRLTRAEELKGVCAPQFEPIRRAFESHFTEHDEVGAALVGEPWGRNPKTFYHTGWGGAFVLADPDARVTIAYINNRMGDLYDSDPRRVGLAGALYASL